MQMDGLQKAYYDIKPIDAMDYDKVNKEILPRLGVTFGSTSTAGHTRLRKLWSQMFNFIHLVTNGGASGVDCRWCRPRSFLLIT